MVHSHRCSAEEVTSTPLLPETAEEVWNEPQHPQIILHLHCGEHPDRLHHRLVWKQHRWVVRTARHIVGGELPSLQDIYTRRCIRKAQRITNDSSHPFHRLFSQLPSGRRLRSIRSRTSRLRDSFFPSGYQANEQPELQVIHPTAHSHFTICHALHFNCTYSPVQTGLHVHTAQIQQSICYHWIPSNAHPWHLCIQLMYNLLHLCILLCMYICVHNVDCVHTVYNVYW